MTRVYDEEDFLPKLKDFSEIIIAENLVDIWDIPNYPLESIDSFSIAFTCKDGTSGTYFSSIGPRSASVYELLECKTFNEALPFIMGHAEFYFSNFPKEMAKDLKLQWEDKYQIIKDSLPLFEKITDKVNVVIFNTMLFLWATKHNASINISIEDLKALYNVAKEIEGREDQFKEISSAKIAIKLKDNLTEA
jgi:hypothetical protein